MALQSISNRQLLDKLTKCGQTDCALWLMENDPAITKASAESYRRIVKSCLQQQKTLKKSISRSKGKENLESFLTLPVSFPTASPHLKKPKETGINCSCSFKYAGENLVEEVKSLKMENEELLADLKLMKPSKISQKTVRNMKRDMKTMKLNLKSLEKRLAVKTKTIRKIRMQNRRQLKRMNKLNAQINMLQDQANLLQQAEFEKENSIQELDQSLDEVKTQLSDVLKERDWLMDVANEENIVNFYDRVSGKYSHELRQCIYTLLSLHVSASNVQPAIEGVLKLVGKRVLKLPSRSTILNMNVERLILSQTQMNEIIQDKPNLTLYTDETSKFGVKYSGYHVSDNTGTVYVMGMRQLLTKSGRDTLEVFKDILGDIDDRSKETDSTSKKILLKITATMSDRASTEKKFNTLLQDLRSEVLPELHENWNLLGREEQTAASTLLNFFCGLHSLVHFAETCNSSLKEVERALFDGETPAADQAFVKCNESGASRLIRTACKALARGADEKSGKFKEFNTYTKLFLKENNMHSLPLQKFHGNRFNVLFESAAAVFFLRDKIKTFLIGHQTNRLLKAVFHDIKLPQLLAEVKALGLISRLVTGPLWCLLEDKTIHILDMNKHYLALVNFLDDSTAHVREFMKGNLLAFGESTMLKKDAIFNSLTSDWEHDDQVEVCLRVVLPALCKLTKRIFCDHLPGGKWEHVTEEIVAKSAGTAKHNKFSESVFGYLDQLLRKKPNVSVLASEAFVMFACNKTQQWLDSKSEEDQQRVIGDAMANVGKVREQFKRRKHDIEEAQKRAVEESLRQAEASEARRLARLEGFTEKMVFYGLWQSVQGVDKGLAGLGVKEKEAALKAQLNFRRYVLKQCPKDEIYRFTKHVNGQKQILTVNELEANVKRLVTHAFTIQAALTDDDHWSVLTGKDVRHKFEQDGEIKWWNGKVISQVPGYPSWYNIIYDEDDSVYTYQLMKDYQAGDLELLVL